MEDFTAATGILSALGGITITGALGLLFKHLTYDHNKMDSRMDSVLSSMKDHKADHDIVLKKLDELEELIRSKK